MTNQIHNIPSVRVADLPQNSPFSFKIKPDQAELSKISKDLELLELRKLSFAGALHPQGKSDWTLKAVIGATVVQPCVITLEPVTSRIDVPVERHFLSLMPEIDSEEEEIEMPEDENAELLGDQIDLAEIMRESLALNLPLFPRAQNAELEENAFTEPGKKAMTDEDARPFAGLAALRESLSDKDRE